MGEATSDRQASTGDPKKESQKAQGWIRMHTNEKAKPPTVDDESDEESQLRDRKARKELEKS
jgi:hypothetical protein